MKKNAVCLICLVVVTLALCTPSMAGTKKYKKFGLTPIKSLGSSPLCECAGVPTGQDLQEMTRTHAAAIEEGFRVAGVPNLAKPYMEAVYKGNFTEGVFPMTDEGKILDWMLYKDKAKNIKTIENFFWVGAKPFEAFRVKVVEDLECSTVVHEILVPKKCMNISILKSHDPVDKNVEPTASIAVNPQLGDGRICIYDTQTVDMSGSKDRDGKVNHVELEIRGQGDTIHSERVNPPYTATYEFQHDGAYELRALAVDNCFNRSKVKKIKVAIDRCIPIADIVLSHDGKAIAGEFLRMDLSGSQDPNGSIESARVTITKDGKLWAWKDLDGSNLIWDFELRKRGMYEITAYVTDNHGFKSENDVTTLLKVRDARHLVVQAGGMINRQRNLPDFVVLEEAETKFYLSGLGGFSYYFYPEGEMVILLGGAFPIADEDYYKSVMMMDFEFNHHERGFVFGVGVGGYDFSRDSRTVDYWLNLGYDIKFTPQSKMTLLFQPRSGYYSRMGLGDNFRMTIGLRMEF
ncbi:hypothetical protein ACFLU6_02750 [Acidobacteriota bacterium]